MFHRVIVEDWAAGLSSIAFCIFAGVFLLVTIRALRLGAGERKRLAALPLDDPTEDPQHRDSAPPRTPKHS